MGNRAVITTSSTGKVQPKNVGIYLHWNGGLDSVTAFLEYAKRQGARLPEEDSYGWAALARIIGNFTGGDGTTVGIETCDNLDCDNGDNGTYFIEGWKVVGRAHVRQGRREQQSHDLDEMLAAIDAAQPESQRLKGEWKIEVSS